MKEVNYSYPLLGEVETLSSNTLFHITSSLDFLTKIIKNGLIPRYSGEDFSVYRWYKDSENLNPVVGIPMVCFCDIPLSKLKHHLYWYGEYGVGIDKKWGMNYGISPLLYIDPLSATTNNIIDLSQLYVKQSSKAPGSEEQYPELFKIVEKFMHYSKPYEGPFQHLEHPVSNKIFYDEREWRFIPDLMDAGLPNAFLFSKDEKEANAQKKDINNALSKVAKPTKSRKKVPITIANIKYILVRTESEIPLIIDALKSKFKKINEADFQGLVTKIITTKQIREDF